MQLLLGRTPVMQEVKRKIELVAKADVPVLLQGESGTGKEVCARLIHAMSPRSRHSLVKVSCPAIPRDLLESELFGYEKGAFTGANVTKQGRVEQAHLGTLILDEVGSLDMFVQATLLQLLQDGTFTRVGGDETRRISTRVISIANQDLRRQVSEGTFRLDLLYRINAVTISLPPLRQRVEDLPELIEHFSQMHSQAFQMEKRPFSKDLLRMMYAYDWPGNIRQLDNLVRCHILLGNEDLLVAEMTPRPSGADLVSAEIDISKPIALKQITKKATQHLERQIITKVLQANGWNRQKTAKWLQISYRSLLYKLSEAENAAAEAAAEERILPPPSPRNESESSPYRTMLEIPG
ncbi:sigma-54 dependent transcriptional regulator [Granulicella sp. WH15]|uniref:sigma-54 interaction domain-containing protein n=1 Tax=Granulicella sp. WH15 TaxID=2602070 RepID=UPI0021083A3C|nr:sigma-54 dependent transcriptional regulator [Granulicella sp. WH15]